MTMQRPRRPGTIAAAAARVIEVLKTDDCRGDEIAADLIEKSAQLIRKWADPDNPATPNASQIRTLDTACWRAAGEAPFIETLQRQVFVARNHFPGDPVERMLEVMAQVGQLAGEVDNAVCPHGDDGRQITLAEHSRLHKAICETKKVLETLDRDIESAAISKAQAAE